MAVGVYEIASSIAQDEALKSFAAATLPIIQEHLQMAQGMMQ